MIDQIEMRKNIDLILDTFSSIELEELTDSISFTIHYKYLTENILSSYSRSLIWNSPFIDDEVINLFCILT